MRGCRQFGTREFLVQPVSESDVDLERQFIGAACHS